GVVLLAGGLSRIVRRFLHAEKAPKGCSENNPILGALRPLVILVRFVLLLAALQFPEGAASAGGAIELPRTRLFSAGEAKAEGVLLEGVNPTHPNARVQDSQFEIDPPGVL